MRVYSSSNDKQIWQMIYVEIDDGSFFLNLIWTKTICFGEHSLENFY